MDATDSFQVYIGLRAKQMSNVQSIVVQDVTLHETVDMENGGRIISKGESIITKELLSDLYFDTLQEDELHAELPKYRGAAYLQYFLMH